MCSTLSSVPGAAATSCASTDARARRGPTRRAHGSARMEGQVDRTSRDLDVNRPVAVLDLVARDARQPDDELADRALVDRDVAGVDLEEAEARRRSGWRASSRARTSSGTPRGAPPGKRTVSTAWYAGRAHAAIEATPTDIRAASERASFAVVPGRSHHEPRGGWSSSSSTRARRLRASP